MESFIYKLVKGHPEMKWKLSGSIVYSKMLRALSKACSSVDSAFIWSVLFSQMPH